MASAETKKRTVFVVSDSSGGLGWHALKSTLELFVDVHVVEQRFTRVASKERIADIVQAAKVKGSCIFYTFANPSHREEMRHLTVQQRVKSVDIAGPAIDCLQEWLGIGPHHEPPHNDDPHSLEALDFRKLCGDGQRPDLWPQADVMIVGLSRTKKSPTGDHLAIYKKLLVADLPLTTKTTPPPELFQIPANRVFVLVMQSSRLRDYRRQRLKEIGLPQDDEYVDPRAIREEHIMVERLLTQNPGWRKIDVTSTGVEEVAGRIVEFLRPNGQ